MKRRSPFAPKNFISFGDWTARVWNDDVTRSPLIAGRCAPHAAAAHARAHLLGCPRVPAAAVLMPLALMPFRPRTLQVRAGVRDGRRVEPHAPGRVLCDAVRRRAGGVGPVPQAQRALAAGARPARLASAARGACRACGRAGGKVLTARRPTHPLPPPPPPWRRPQVKVTDEALTSFSAQDNGAVIAVGAAGGAVHVLRLSAGLAEAAQNEKAGIAAMLEREVLRCARARAGVGQAVEATRWRLTAGARGALQRERPKSSSNRPPHPHPSSPPPAGRRTWRRAPRRQRSRRARRRRARPTSPTASATRRARSGDGVCVACACGAAARGSLAPSARRGRGTRTRIPLLSSPLRP